MSLAERVIEEFEGNVRLRKRLAELLVVEPDVRLTLINAVLAEVATKKDVSEVRAEISQLRKEIGAEVNQLRSEIKAEISQLRSEVRAEINQLRSEISELRREISSNFRWTIGVVITVWGATVIPILLRLVGVI